jgi:hypothetical protein
MVKILLDSLNRTLLCIYYMEILFHGIVHTANKDDHISA